MKLDLQSRCGAVDAMRHRYVGFSLPLLLCIASCSQPRKPTEEIDWGQPPPRTARQPRPTEEQPTSAGEGANAGGSEGEPQGNGGHGSAGRGESDGSGGAASGGEAASTSPNAPGSAETAERSVPGGGGEEPSPSEPEGPAPALPGRAAIKPRFSAAEAATSAERLLKQAQQLLRKDDLSAAAEAALEAYDQVLPHAESDPQCRKISRQLESVLDAAGRGQGQADAVPTRFE